MIHHYGSFSGRPQFTTPPQVVGLSNQMMHTTTSSPNTLESSTVGSVSAADYAPRKTNKIPLTVEVIQNDSIYTYKSQLLPLSGFFN